MSIYPVIMCGGAGTRLWPASRPSLPKQFMLLAGSRSLFQETVVRVAALTAGGGELIVVGGVSHRRLIFEQLEALEVRAQVLLEPEARDSAAAMTAAAVWTQQRDPAGINVFVASDHFIPDDDAFREAILGAVEGASGGSIVTLGVRPTEPSSAYGYIQASGAGLSPVKAFVEKPTRETAVRYIAEGHMWNSGNFIVAASVLLEEMLMHAPAVLSAVRGAIPDEARVGPLVLGPSFASAPKVSIDYAVLEKTTRAAVLPVNFAWSDLGAWDAVAATGEGDSGVHLFDDAEGCLIRAPDGVIVVAVGVRNLAVVVEKDAVLVCDLARSQDVKRVVDRLKSVSPQHLDFQPAPLLGLAEAAGRFRDWLRLSALPIWGTIGQDAAGGFVEALTLNGKTVASHRRARVQMRQIQVFAEAGRLGWQGPWKTVVERALQRLREVYLREDGLVRTLLTDEGTPVDETAFLYDQAFYLFALAAAATAGVAGDHAGEAAAALQTITGAAPGSGGLVEAGEMPFQSNAHMHLLEASLAWEGLGTSADWAAFSDRIVGVALRYFIDGEGGFLREFFNADWSPHDGEPGRLVEPGHQFEWAWLLARYARLRSDANVLGVAKRLYEFGMRGIDGRRSVAVDALNDDGSVRSRRARLWPQTEWIKAALILAEMSTDSARAQYLVEAGRAHRGLWPYLTPQGLWKDKMLIDGTFIDEPAPASSFYHIMAAYSQLAASEGVLKFGLGDVDLG